LLAQCVRLRYLHGDSLTVPPELQPPLAAGANVSMHTAVRQKEAFLLGPYLDFLPAAVVGQVRALEH